MFKRLLAVGSVIALALTMGTITFASANGHDRTIRITVVADEFNFVDEAPKGDSLLDEFALSGDVWNANQAKKIGNFGVNCTIVDVSRGLAQCDATFDLHGSEITTQGLSPFSGAPDIDAITGGTGKYEGASGEAHVGSVSGEVVKVTLHIDLD